MFFLFNIRNLDAPVSERSLEEILFSEFGDDLQLYGYGLLERTSCIFKKIK
jgi:hypothetical protein